MRREFAVSNCYQADRGSALPELGAAPATGANAPLLAAESGKKPALQGGGLVGPPWLRDTGGGTPPERLAAPLPPYTLIHSNNHNFLRVPYSPLLPT